MSGISLVLLLAGGMPVALALLAATLVFILVTGNQALLESLPPILFGSLEIFDLLAIPLFVLLGELMNAGGMTRRVVTATRAWLGRLPNSLAYVSLVANLVLAAIMGSATAQIAVMSRVIVPAMERDGYSRSYAAGLTASAGLLGPIIPPSMPFIIFGVVGQVPIADLFVGGIAPGLLLFALLAGSVPFLARRSSLAPPADETTAAERVRLLLDALATLAIPAVIIGGILGGVVTPTESAGIAVVVAVVVGGLVYGELRWADLGGILDRTASSTALVLFLIMTAKAFGWVLTFNQVPQEAAAWLRSLTDDPVVFLFLVFGAMLVVGMILDGIAAIIVLVPILLPIATGVYGIDPVQFGVVMCMTLILGLLTPPVGAGLYIAAAISGVGIVRLSIGLFPYVVMTCGVIVLVILFPDLVRLF